MLEKKRYYILVLIIVLSFGSNAQEQFGMANSNYSPTASMFHNPSSIVDSEVMMDIHVGGIGAFLHSNYAYLKADEFSYFKNIMLNEGIPNAHFNHSRDEYSLYSTVDIQYLVATYQYKNHGFGFSSRVRSFADVRNVPEIFANGIQVPQITGQGQFTGNILGRDLTAKNVNIGVLSYAEFGLSYANAVYHRDRNLTIVGGAVKFLSGIGGGGIHVDEFNYKIDSTGVFSYSNFTGRTALSSGLFSGAGFAADIGFTYKKMLDNVTNYNPFRKEAGCRIYNYKWKVGVSLIDLGFVKFTKNTERSSVTEAAGVIDNFSNLTFRSEPDVFLNQTLGVPDSLIITDTNDFRVIVPAAIVFQSDYNFEKYNMFLSVQYINGLVPGGSFGIKRPQVIAFTPRYETRHFEAAFTFGMYNLQEVRTGMMLRFGPFSIGTDKLGTFFSVTDVTGFDVYAHLSFKILQQKRCGKKRYW